MNINRSPLTDLFAVFLAVSATLTTAESQPKSVLKTESFDRDPGWEGRNNHLAPKHVATVKQDFGYSPTHFAGKEAGEVGGRVTRSTRPAYYAAKIAPKSLNDRLSASGTFAITSTGAGGGVFFGWFQSAQPGASGRPIGSFGLDFGSERSGGRLAIRLINGLNKSKGVTVTARERKNKPTSIRNDGTRYRWKLDYDPDANIGNGRFTFTISSDAAQREDFEGKVLSADLPPGFKQEGASFDRFGMMNMMKAGGTIQIYFADLQHDGQNEILSKDPGWISSGNRESYEDREKSGVHDFGYSAKTSFAGGSAGELGGTLWRGGDYSYYADRIGPLTMRDRLEARGKIVLLVGGPDSGACLGFFSGEHQNDDPSSQAGDFVGVQIGGPTRIGHYFAPAYATGATHGHANAGPILTPGKIFQWSLVYDPLANNGLGAITASLGGETVTLELKKNQKIETAHFDHFGLFTPHVGGQAVKIYLDDLKYTAGRDVLR